MASRLSKHMYEGTGTKPNIDENFEYGPYDDPNIPCVKSSSTSTSALRDYLNKYVSCGTYYDKYAPDPLLNTINANRQTPCVAIMGGTHAANEQAEKGSHAWVIDGYLICVKTSKEILKKNDLYFHANMGWGGPDNGFYKVNADTSTDFETELGNYNANFWEITEIRRK
ncbi:C10 family peptidase, partial [Bacteroides uniformis]